MTIKPKTRNAAAPDPIFAAIAEHKALVKEYVRCNNISAAARKKAEKRLGKSLEGRHAAADATRPEYQKMCRAGGAEAEAAMRMAKTRPATAAGAAALINHVRREIEASFVLGVEDWMVPALKTVADVLSSKRPPYRE
jgi:hypothetical protein